MARAAKGRTTAPFWRVRVASTSSSPETAVHPSRRPRADQLAAARAMAAKPDTVEAANSTSFQTMER